MQIDNPERGFSYKFEGPLDLRLNPEKGISAAERLEDITKAEFEGMLIENADEPYAKQIAKETVATMKRGKKIKTTTDLKDVIERALNFLPEKERKEAVKKSCQRTFQALRIEVNGELDVLKSGLESAVRWLAPGGRIAVISYHSLEDRIVKDFFREYSKGCTCPPDLLYAFVGTSRYSKWSRASQCSRLKRKLSVIRVRVVRNFALPSAWTKTHKLICQTIGRKARR